MLKRILNFAVLIIGILGCGRLWYQATDGFRVDRVRGELPLSVGEEVPQEVSSLLEGPFRYLGRGRQMFVFERGDVVLKIPRMDRYRPTFWNRVVQGVKYKRQKEDRLRRKSLFLNSLRISREELQEETGVLYVHLGPTGESLGSVRLVDRLGREVSLSLNETPFVLQKKCPLLCDVLPQMSEGERQEALELLALTLRTCIERGIANKDPHLVPNLGWNGKEVVLLDLGTFYRPAQLNGKEMMWGSTREFRAWLKSWEPHLCSVFEATLQ